MKMIRVLLADDHDIVRAGLRALLETAGDIKVIGEAENGRQTVAEAERLRPDVVLLDLAMPLLDGLEATRQIAQQMPATRVLILSTFSDGQHVQQAMEAGATGYLMKQAAAEDCLRAIREACNGNRFFSPPIARSLSKQWQSRDLQGKPTVGSELTRRQTEVLQLIAEGYPSKQISGLLSLSDKTVGAHRQALMRKLDIHGIAALTRYAVSRGFVKSNPAPKSPFIPIGTAADDAARFARP